MLNSNHLCPMKTTFSEYMEKTYLSWQMDNGRASIREYSRWLDINHALIIQWMNGKAKPGPKSLPKLAAKLGLEIYDILGLARPNTIPLDKLPSNFRKRLTAAVYEVNAELVSRGVSSDSPEGEEIVTEIFELHGFKYTNTTNP
jgi:hypothetical protein